MTEAELEYFSEMQEEGEMTFKQIAEELGVTKNVVQGQIYRWRGREGRRQALESSWEERTRRDPKTGVEVKSQEVDGSTFAEIKDKSPEELLQFVGVDPEQFELTKSYFNQYGGKTSVRVEFKPRELSAAPEELTEAISSAFATMQQHSIEEYLERPDSEVSIVVPLFDLHFGGSDTSYLFSDVLPWLRSRIGAANYADVTFILGGDLLQGEDEKGTTTSGTNTQTPFNMVDAAANLVVFIQGLRSILMDQGQVGSIHFINGNHAKYTEKAIMGALRAIDEENVIIHDDWMGFIDRAGTPVVAYHGAQVHKNKVKESQYLEYFQNMMPELLANSILTKHRINVFTGHIHSLKIEDVSGIRINRVPMVPDRSEYEIANGLVGSDNKPTLFMYRSGNYAGMLSMSM